MRVALCTGCACSTGDQGARFGQQSSLRWEETTRPKCAGGRDYVSVGRRSCSAVGPFRCPDLVAAQVKPDGPPTFREIALDLHLVRPDDLITRDTDSAPAGAEPRHSAILLREIAGEDLRADAASVVVQFAQSASPQEVGGVLPGRSTTRRPYDHGSQTRSSSFGPSSMSHRACFSLKAAKASTVSAMALTPGLSSP